jgi:hypothetical protein
MGNVIITGGGRVILFRWGETDDKNYQLPPAQWAELQAQIAAADLARLKGTYADQAPNSYGERYFGYGQGTGRKNIYIAGKPELPSAFQRLLDTLDSVARECEEKGAVLTAPPSLISYQVRGGQDSYTRHLTIDRDGGIYFHGAGPRGMDGQLVAQDLKTLQHLVAVTQRLGTEQRYNYSETHHTNPELDQVVTVTIYADGAPAQTLTTRSGAPPPAEFESLVGWLAQIYDDYVAPTP